MKSKLMALAILASLFLALQPSSAASDVDSVQETLIACDADTLEQILRSGGNANWTDENGFSALRYALLCDSSVDGSQHSIVRRLLAHGANISIPDTSGMYVLEAAVVDSPAATVDLLLSAGADPNQQTSMGVSLLALARASENDEVARVLIEHGAIFGSSSEEIEGQVTRELRKWQRTHPNATIAERDDAEERILLLHLPYDPEVEAYLDSKKREFTCSTEASEIPESMNVSCHSGCESSYRRCNNRCSSRPWYTRPFCYWGCKGSLDGCLDRCASIPVLPPQS